MTTLTLEERVMRLEQLVEQLLQERSQSQQPGRDDWQKTIGMFAGDQVMKEIIDAGRLIREDDRKNSLLALGGTWKVDDPYIAEYLEILAANRREMDADESIP